MSGTRGRGLFLRTVQQEQKPRPPEQELAGPCPAVTAEINMASNCPTSLDHSRKRVSNWPI